MWLCGSKAVTCGLKAVICGFVVQRLQHMVLWFKGCDIWIVPEGIDHSDQMQQLQQTKTLRTLGQ